MTFSASTINPPVDPMGNWVGSVPPVREGHRARQQPPGDGEEAVEGTVGGPAASAPNAVIVPVRSVPEASSLPSPLMSTAPVRRHSGPVADEVAVLVDLQVEVQGRHAHGGVEEDEVRRLAGGDEDQGIEIRVVRRLQDAGVEDARGRVVGQGPIGTGDRRAAGDESDRDQGGRPAGDRSARLWRWSHRIIHRATASATAAAEPATGHGNTPFHRPPPFAKSCPIRIIVGKSFQLQGKNSDFFVLRILVCEIR